MKEKLQELVEALINGDRETAEKALHEYLTAKTQTILSEGDDDKDESECEECGKSPCKCDDDDSDDDSDDDDKDDDSDDDSDDDDDEDDEDEVEEEEELKRKGRRTDKASKGRTKK